MQLKQIKLTGWRNYIRQEFFPEAGINLIFGENGQGKTNLLEAVYFLSTGYSPRVFRTDQLINWSADYLFVSGNASADAAEVKVEMGLHRDGRRVNKLNGSLMRRLADVAGNIRSILFVPGDLELIKGSPGKRRRFVNLELSQLDRSYRVMLGQYRGVLQQRNALLKKQQQFDAVLFDVLTEKLIRLAMAISEKRDEFVKKLSLLTRLRHRLLSDNREELTLQYRPSLVPGQYSAIADQFKAVRAREKVQRTSLLGPHRDDILFLLDRKELREFGSQGQQRTAVLAVKLAEIELFHSHTGEKPVLLLDDVFSELDERRCRLLLEFLSGNIQTLITATEALQVNANKKFVVIKGNVKELTKG